MQHIHIRGSAGASDIMIGGRLRDLQSSLRAENLILVSDETVAGLYGHLFPAGPLITISPGEASKTLEGAARIYREMIACNADRSSLLIGIGGGVVCDLAGFVASTYMRGIRFAFAPTTLLAQVDASVGGKNGLNLDGYKNMIGLFNQPELVLCDPDVLASLPDRELGCGLAEIVKHAAIADSRLFGFLENTTSALLNRDRPALERVVAASVRIKSGVVNTDEKEKGQRAILNFGHTFGHALEKLVGLPHGQAVSLGMVTAAAMSVQRGLLSEAEHFRLISLLQAFRLPTRLEPFGLVPKDLLQAMFRDKKREGDTLHLVLLHGLGRAVIQPMSLIELEETLPCLL